MKTETTEEKLKALPEKYKDITKPLMATGATQVVPGWGSPTADLMFVGEAPGATEDKTGIPFTGAAGKFLDELLGSINIKREETYITNMVKVRPPGNRDPKDEELLAYKPWLDEEILLVKPKLIVTLGRFSMGKFLPDQMISKAHGKFFKVEDRIFFVMYHPAVALYNGSMRSVMMEDMKKLGKALKTI